VLLLIHFLHVRCVCVYVLRGILGDPTLTISSPTKGATLDPSAQGSGTGGNNDSSGSNTGVITVRCYYCIHFLHARYPCVYVFGGGGITR